MTGSRTAAEVDSQAPGLPSADRASDSPPVPVAPAPPGGDWDAARGDVQCPLCEYDLRGLVEPRCPECGYAFTWPDVTDPARRLHPFLFEHHPERNVWSFRRTLLGTLRPRRFWAALRPAQPGRTHRLLVYWLLAATPMLLAAVAWNAKQVVAHARSMALARARVQAQLVARGDTPEKRQIVREFGSIGGYLDATFPARRPFRFFYSPWRGPGALNCVVLAWLAWPWMTFLTLLVFQFSMRRARVRTVHVLRCVLYGFDAIWWAGLVVAAVVAWQIHSGAALPGRTILSGLPDFLAMVVNSYGHDLVARTAAVAAAVLLPVMTYRTVVAYGLYLRFDRPAATVLTSQAIVLLVVMVVAVNGAIVR